MITIKFITLAEKEDEIVSALAELFYNHANYANASQEARQIAQKYDDERIGEMYASMIAGIENKLELVEPLSVS